MGRRPSPSEPQTLLFTSDEPADLVPTAGWCRPPAVPPDAGCSRSTLADRRPELATRLRPGSLRSALLLGPPLSRTGHITAPLPRGDHPMITNSSRKDETLERLTNGIAQLTSSDSWTTWLRVQARFHRYSFSNALLVALQCPGATRVTGFHTWRRLGRTVRRGESALWILAPVTRRVVSDDTEQQTGVVTAFRAVPVFDISQTTGQDLPEICTHLSGNDPLPTLARSGLATTGSELGAP